MTIVKDKSFYKLLIIIALPVAFQGLISFGVNMVDTVMVGSLGEISLSSVSLANQVSFFITMFIRGISGGTSVLISQYWGKKDINRIKLIFGMGIKVSFGLSFFLSVLVLLFPRVIMMLLTNDLQIVEEGTKYLCFVAYSYIFFSITEVIISMLRCIEIVKISLIVTCFSFLFNAFFNWVLIFGHLGFPKMGIVGAALATTIARLLELIIVLLYVKFSRSQIKIQIKGLFAHDSLLWMDFLKYAAPIICGDMLWALVGVIKSTIIGRMGYEYIAANSIAEVMIQLSTIFVFGLSSGACVIIGKTIGEKRYDTVRLYSKTLQVMFFVFGGIACLTIFLLRVPFINLYNISAQTYTLAMQFMAIAAITVWGTSYAAACFVGINRGGGDAQFVMKVDLIAGWLIILPFTAITGLVLGMPAPVVFFASKCDQLIKVVVAFIRLRGDKWIKNVTRE